MIPLLEVNDVVKKYPIRSGMLRRRVGWVNALDGVSLTLKQGESIGIVGESGCGKTTLARIMMGLIAPDEGRVGFEGRYINDWLKKDNALLRQRIQIVFQDPLDSLDPRLSVFQSISEPLVATGLKKKGDIIERVSQTLIHVALPKEILSAYPHELSGGMRQRVGIARAMVVRPRLIVCDEPVSSLDLSIQRQILELLLSLQKDFGVSFVFISHDLSVVRMISHRVAVMYMGKIVESGSTSDVFKNPKHPYTDALLKAIPLPDPKRAIPVVPLSGEVPSLKNVPSGCRFRTRCPIAEKRCAETEPKLLSVGPDWELSCHLRS